MMPKTDPFLNEPIVTPYGLPDAEKPDKVGIVDAAIKAVKLENDVYALYDRFTRQRFSEDPEFNWFERAQTSPYILNYGDQLSRAKSNAEFNAIENRIKEELADKQALASLGTGTGMLLGMTAGMLSPTMAIPLVGQARGVKGVAQAFALAAAGATIQETTLFLSQETRTPEEVMAGIGTGTILGGLLGSAVSYLPRAARVRIEKEWKEAKFGDVVDDVEPPGVATMTVANPEAAADLSAATYKIHPDPGPLKGFLGKQSKVERATGRLNPVTRLATDVADIGPRVEKVLDSEGNLVDKIVDTPVPIEESAEFSRSLSDAGMKNVKNEEGIPTVIGGTVENRRIRHGAPLVKTIHYLDEAYMRYLYGEEVTPGIFGVNKLMAQLRSGMRMLPEGKLTKNQFNEEVVWALNTGDRSPSGIPQVDETAKAIR